ncbi:MAG TPA: hypothetical protein PKA27_06495 [Fimbriimonadaceae bacterium]|nr:hypothetical protein [Fimbriimonadaceae bacterium]
MPHNQRMERDPAEQIGTKGIDPERWSSLLYANTHPDVEARIAKALITKHGVDKAADIAFHLSDWIAEATTLVAIHLDPDAFTDEEIEDAVEAMAIHSNHHLMAATHLLEFNLNDVFNLGLQIQPGDEEDR